MVRRITRLLLVAIGACAFALPSHALNKRILVGYWHNFKNGAANGLKLSQVDDSWDVINLSFAEPTSATSGILQYNPTADDIYASAEEFKADVKAVQAKGKKVMLSIGGANGQVRLENTTARDNFIRTAEEIIDTYGLDGLDIDFEGHSLSFQSGDLDLANPTTPVIVNLIYALKQICAHYGDDFLLTFAPETFFVQQAYSFYYPTAWGCDERSGAYLPVLYALRDRLNWLQVQYYNSGLITSPEGGQNCYTEDFVVNLANMLLTGFDIAQAANKLTGPTRFPALRQDQVVLGVPSVAGSAGGVYTTDQLINIYNRLRAKGWTEVRGFMTWSINWDVFGNKAWSTLLRAYINDLNNGGDGGSQGGGDEGGGDEGGGDEGGGDQGGGDCGDVPEWDASHAYNVYGEEAGIRVQYNHNIYELITWGPVGTTPDQWANVWTLIGPCGGQTTGIDRAQRSQEGTGTYYGIGGIKEEKPKKGLYIHRNKKVVVK